MGKIIEGNKKIEAFWIEQGGKPHLEPDIHFYESDWNMLMPVVEKIEDEEHPVSLDPTKGTAWFKVDIINRNSVEITLRDESIVFIENGTYKTKIEAVWNAVVEFITWYNQHSPSK